MKRWAFPVVLSVILTALLPGCGATKEAATTEATTPAQPTCEVAPRLLVNALNDSWKKKSMHVARAWMVKSGDKGKEPMMEGGTVYLVGAYVKPNPGIVVFGVDEEMTKTGGGIAVGINASARASSYMGDQVSPEAYGLSEDMDGFQTAYDCAG